ncbi:hypothetical protein DFH09DRAFT_1164756, partial [Mycena vulgaris]
VSYVLHRPLLFTLQLMLRFSPPACCHAAAHVTCTCHPGSDERGGNTEASPSSLRCVYIATLLRAFTGCAHRSCGTRAT